MNPSTVGLSGGGSKVNTHETLMRQVGQVQLRHDQKIKITIVGAGQVGMAIAYAILNQSLVSELVIVDAIADKVKGEVMDLQHGTTFLKHVKVTGSVDYEESGGSRVCIVTAGARQREGESRLDLIQRNTDILKQIIPNLVKHSPNTILLVATNPVDIMSFVAWKLSGLDKTRVLGSGTNLDSSRFRFIMSERLNIAPSSCHGWIIGEHGDSSVPVWSGVNIAGVRLRDIHPGLGQPEDHEEWTDIHRQVVDSAYEIIRLKGYTSWGIGVSITRIVESVLHNERNVLAISTLVKGFHGIEEEVFLSLPAVIGANGVSHVINQTLTDQEINSLQTSANTLHNAQKNIKM